MKRKHFFCLLGIPLAYRYSDGGASPTAPATGEGATGAPTADAGATQGADPTPPKAPEQTPPKKEAEPPKEGEAKTYTEADLEAARKAGEEEARRHFKETTDYEKMTPEEKVAHLEKQMAEEKLTRYTADALSKAGMDATLAEYVKGSDEASTDERVKAFKEVFDKAVQAGVEGRFKDIGYTPRAGGVGSPVAEGVKKPRGVSVK